jgi:hypothetical protein
MTYLRLQLAERGDLLCVPSIEPGPELREQRLDQLRSGVRDATERAEDGGAKPGSRPGLPPGREVPGQFGIAGADLPIAARLHLLVAARR